MDANLMTRPQADSMRDMAFAAASPAGGSSRRVMPSAELLQGAKAVEIAHNGAIYRLQATRLGKLILTK